MITVRNSSQSYRIQNQTAYTSKSKNTQNTAIDSRKELIRENLQSIIKDAADIIGKYKDQEKIENEKRMAEVLENVEKRFGKKATVETDNTVSVDNTIFTNDEITNAVNVLDSAEKTLQDSTSKSKILDYVNYGHFEIARNIVDKYSQKNLNPEQGELLNKALNSFIDKSQALHENIIKQSYEKTGYEFYGLRKTETAQMDDLATVTDGVVVATNLELINKVTTLFSSVDFSDGESVSKAIKEYKSLVGQAYEEVIEEDSKIEDKLNCDEKSLENTINNILSAAMGITHISDEV